VLDDLGDVLQHDPSGSKVTENPGDRGPEPAVIINTAPFAGGAERLAGESGSDEIHFITPRCAIEGREIVPYRSAIQPLFFHPRHESGRCVGVPLNVTHGSGNVGEGEGEPAVSGAELEHAETPVVFSAGGRFGT